MFFHREKKLGIKKAAAIQKAQENAEKNRQAVEGLQGAQLFLYFEIVTVLAKLQFLLTGVDAAKEYVTTISFEEALSHRVGLLEKIHKQLSEQLTEEDSQEALARLVMPYSYFGKMLFAGLAGNEAGTILKVEETLRDEPLIDKDRTSQDMIFAYLLQDFNEKYDGFGMAQAGVMDYLLTRWDIDGDRHQRLKEKQLTHEELVTMLDKIWKSREDTSGPTMTQE